MGKIKKRSMDNAVSNYGACWIKTTYKFRINFGFRYYLLLQFVDFDCSVLLPSHSHQGALFSHLRLYQKSCLRPVLPWKTLGLDVVREIIARTLKLTSEFQINFSTVLEKCAALSFGKQMPTCCNRALKKTALSPQVHQTKPIFISLLK